MEGSRKTSDTGSSINLDAYSTPSSIVSTPTVPVHVLSWLQSLLYLFIQIGIFTTPVKTCPQILAFDLKSSCGTHMMANEYYLKEQHNSWPSGTKVTTGRNYLVYSQFLFSFYKSDISLDFSIQRKVFNNLLQQYPLSSRQLDKNHSLRVRDSLRLSTRNGVILGDWIIRCVTSEWQLFSRPKLTALAKWVM